MADNDWWRSPFCTGGTCVELARTKDAVMLRDAKEPGQPPLVAGSLEWDQFVAGVKAGDFDF